MIAQTLMRRKAIWHRPCVTGEATTNRIKKMNVMLDEGRWTEVGRADFKSEVLDSKRPVLAVFWASWSRACRVVEPVLDEIMAEVGGRVKLVRINADANPGLALWHGIQSLPTLVYFVEGLVRARIVGTASKEAILAKLEPFAPGDGSTRSCVSPS